MPQTMPLGIHLAVRGQWTNGRPVVSSWHAILTAVGGRPTACAEAGSRMRAQWFTHMLPVLPDNYSLQDVAWTDMNAVDGATGVAGGTAATGGDISAAGTPPNVGVMVTKNFAGSGRSKRTGRLFLPGNLETLVDENGVVSSGKLTQVVTALNAFMGGFNTTSTVGAIGSVLLVVAHTPSISVTETKTVKRPNPDGVLSFDQITGFTANTLTRGIRRRVTG